MGSERIKEWTQTDWTQTRSVKIKERQTPLCRSIRPGLICFPAKNSTGKAILAKT